MNCFWDEGLHPVKWGLMRVNMGKYTLTGHFISSTCSREAARLSRTMMYKAAGLTFFRGFVDTLFCARTSCSYSRQSGQDHRSSHHQCWSFRLNIAWNFLRGSAHRHSSSFCPYPCAKIGTIGISAFWTSGFILLFFFQNWKFWYFLKAPNAAIITVFYLCCHLVGTVCVAC